LAEADVEDIGFQQIERSLMPFLSTDAIYGSWLSGQRQFNNRLKLTARGSPSPESRLRTRAAA
jgi:hypothetical protein